MIKLKIQKKLTIQVHIDLLDSVTVNSPHKQKRSLQSLPCFVASTHDDPAIQLDPIQVDPNVVWT
jgi:hypothetical protein